MYLRESHGVLSSESHGGLFLHLIRLLAESPGSSKFNHMPYWGQAFLLESKAFPLDLRLSFWETGVYPQFSYQSGELHLESSGLFLSPGHCQSHPQIFQHLNFKQENTMLTFFPSRRPLDLYTDLSTFSIDYDSAHQRIWGGQDCQIPEGSAVSLH